MKGAMTPEESRPHTEDIISGPMEENAVQTERLGQPTDAATNHPQKVEPHWTWLKRFLFRFGLLYFLFYTHPFPLDSIPNPRSLEQVFEQNWDWLNDSTDPVFEVIYEYSQWIRERENDAIDWLATSIFSIDEPLHRPYGSGDPTHSYVRLFFHATLAFLGAMIWSRLARRKIAHPKLAAWLHLGVRYSLAFTLMGYGFVKLFPNQFPEPRPSRLIASWGDGTPMNILWTFMGSSAAYVIFSGIGELLGFVLLLFRRTATLGALVAAGVMANVAMLNFSYDVPVKLYSAHLLLFALFLCIPDLRRLLAVFVLNRDVGKRDLRYPRFPYFGVVVKVLVVGTAALGAGYGQWKFRNEYFVYPEMRGIWDVERFVLNGEERPPLQTDSIRWQNFIVDYASSAVVRGMDETRSNHGLAIDDENQTLSLSTLSNWSYELESDGTVTLRGEFQRTHVPNPREAVGPENKATPEAPQIEIQLVRRPSESQEGGPTTGLQGTWDVRSFNVIGDTFLPRRRSLPFGWSAITIMEDNAVVEYDDGHQDEYGFALDQPPGFFQLQLNFKLNMSRPSEEQLTLSGIRAGHELEIDLRRRDLNEFLLLRRGFHWINEIPLNRY